MWEDIPSGVHFITCQRNTVNFRKIQVITMYFPQIIINQYFGHTSYKNLKLAKTTLLFSLHSTSPRVVIIKKKKKKNQVSLFLLFGLSLNKYQEYLLLARYGARYGYTVGDDRAVVPVFMEFTIRRERGAFDSHKHINCGTCKKGTEVSADSKNIGGRPKWPWRPSSPREAILNWWVRRPQLRQAGGHVHKEHRICLTGWPIVSSTGILRALRTNSGYVEGGNMLSLEQHIQLSQLLLQLEVTMWHGSGQYYRQIAYWRRGHKEIFACPILDFLL